MIGKVYHNKNVHNVSGFAKFILLLRAVSPEKSCIEKDLVNDYLETILH